MTGQAQAHAAITLNVTTMIDKLEQHEFMSEIQCFDCDAHLRDCDHLHMKDIWQPVIDAWNIEGKVPSHHRHMKNKLMKEWPSLYRALKKMELYTSRNVLEEMQEHQLDNAREVQAEMKAVSKEGLIGGGEV